MTIADKLTEISDAKQAIVSAVQNKGGTLADKPPIADIASAIEALPSDSGAVGVFSMGGIICLHLEVIDFAGVAGKVCNSLAYYSSVKELSNTENVTTIGNNSFAYCSSLTSVNFPSVTTISDNAFPSCSSLTSVNFPSATIIGSSSFAYCSSLTSVNFPSAKSIGNNSFAYCSSLTSVNFPSVTTISDNAFNGCSSLELVFIGRESPVVPTLGGKNVFKNTSESLCIVVPDSLVEDYKTATNWTYVANKIIGTTEWSESQ